MLNVTKIVSNDCRERETILINVLIEIVSMSLIFNQPEIMDRWKDSLI